MSPGGSPFSGGFSEISSYLGRIPFLGLLGFFLDSWYIMGCSNREIGEQLQIAWESLLPGGHFTGEPHFLRGVKCPGSIPIIWEGLFLGEGVSDFLGISFPSKGLSLFGDILIL